MSPMFDKVIAHLNVGAQKKTRGRKSQYKELSSSLTGEWASWMHRKAFDGRRNGKLAESLLELGDYVHYFV